MPESEKQSSIPFRLPERLPAAVLHWLRGFLAGLFAAAMASPEQRRERQLVRWADEWRSVERILKKWMAKDGTEAGDRSANGRLPRRVAAVLGRVGNNLRQLEMDLDHLRAVMAGDHRLLKQTADALDEELRRVRMLPFADACQGLDRMLRDLAQAGGK